MPKNIELTVEIEIQRVSCPGVWLCQDGRVSLSVYALGTSYQTCLLPPIFPLLFKDVFYFKKRFDECCALSNINCLLKDEPIYCELVQWSEDCLLGDCSVLAQYVGALNDVLFPSNLCSTDGVDLLMRRTDKFPGILSPKIEIATKVRIDEIWNQPCVLPGKVPICYCARGGCDGHHRQRQVCHSPQYHRRRCSSHMIREPTHSSCSRSRSRSTGSKSCCSLLPNCSSTRRPRIESQYEDKLERIILESRYINDRDDISERKQRKRSFKTQIRPCVCEICKRYYEHFHCDKEQSN